MSQGLGSKWNTFPRNTGFTFFARRFLSGRRVSWPLGLQFLASLQWHPKGRGLAFSREGSQPDSSSALSSHRLLAGWVLPAQDSGAIRMPPTVLNSCLQDCTRPSLGDSPLQSEPPRSFITLDWGEKLCC